MAEGYSREHLQPSLLDRLTDDEPDRTREAADKQSLSMQQLRSSVLRDLGWLLGTTRLEATDDLAEMPQVARSVLNYGIAGFAGQVRTGGRAQSLEAVIAQAIRAFEPRIDPDTLRVRLKRDAESLDTALVFEIQGELWARPIPLQLYLETAIELETRAVLVKERR